MRKEDGEGREAKERGKTEGCSSILFPLAARAHARRERRVSSPHSYLTTEVISIVRRREERKRGEMERFASPSQERDRLKRERERDRRNGGREGEMAIGRERERKRTQRKKKGVRNREKGRGEARASPHDSPCDGICLPS